MTATVPSSSGPPLTTSPPRSPSHEAHSFDASDVVDLVDAQDADAQDLQSRAASEQQLDTPGSEPTATAADDVDATPGDGAGPTPATSGRSSRISAARSSASAARTERTRELFTRALEPMSEAERQVLLDEVIVLHLDLAHSEAKRYRSRGVPLDDLQQVAALALTKATNGYDVTTGHNFLSYAVPTIRGELRKHFRDHGWMIRPPRRIQELQARINVADAELANELGRSPQPQEIADRLGDDVEQVIEALSSDGCFVPASLDHPAGGDGLTSLGDLLPLDDLDHQASEARMVLQPVLQHLSERDRQILALRFYDGLTQREIAGRIGVTQMQVSRLLTRILGQLRNDVGELRDE
ncbi:RNA polymerase sigma-B factor [Nocardioides scoriae]|uniref:RNA polymerase sigma-B factor n=1 Tax=Nocardioides scoriae TaxID=642780 RepID=A0A1H1RTB3_9ACTN|nr:sigma-70 family RNA polymerase sigma factor [Nocardioides scoriae]SDS38968.1 RNA polymerase sigma-B factor [Nocardioides scoriae]